jgi:hypothetical protein
MASQQGFKLYNIIFGLPNRTSSDRRTKTEEATAWERAEEPQVQERAQTVYHLFIYDTLFL